jgi:hypothetical protein
MPESMPPPQAGMLVRGLGDLARLKLKLVFCGVIVFQFFTRFDFAWVVISTGVRWVFEPKFNR